MIELLEQAMKAQRKEMHLFFRRLLDQRVNVLQHSEIVEALEIFLATEAGAVLRGSAVEPVLRAVQEGTIQAPSLYLAIRTKIGTWRFCHVQVEEMFCRQVQASEFLQFRERLVEPRQRPGDWVLEVDLKPFERGFPKLKDTRSIGRGVEFLNRYLSNRLFDQFGKGDQRLFDFLRLHQVQGRQLMLNARLQNVQALRDALRDADDVLHQAGRDAQWPELESQLAGLGFEPGWGRTAEQIRQTMALLADLLEAPDANLIANFLARIPMIFNIIIVSPHGYFGQSGVLGMPDTGGQVVYILDQVRALEREMRRSIHEQGLDVAPHILVVTRLIPEAGHTNCNQPVEAILGTEHARILRVPFRSRTGEILEHWTSRFEVWPYLEQFAVDAEEAISAELDEQADFVIGNYSDGNLVAALLSERLGITQCTIAHALEKTKYLNSDLFWKEHENEHHFACQYTADLIAMNTADFIIASSYQEIAGTPESVGQYESYQTFTLPGLYRVLNGVDVCDPKFNIVSPGADANVFFPYTDTDRRLTELEGELMNLVFGDSSENARGCIPSHDRPLLFAMSRLDAIKNVTGMVEWYARHKGLREQANLFVIAGQTNAARSGDDEERAQIDRMHALFDQYQLDANVRWVGARLDKNLTGELYRFVADRRGVFVQPALFEAFGLTVIEAMASGLPTFATLCGGPLEIIEHDTSGFHIDPYHGEAAADLMAGFFQRCREDADEWSRISEGAIRRVEARYTWKLYARRLLSLSRIYGFWKFISNIEREETRRYLEMFYGLMFKPLANMVQDGAPELRP